MTAMQDASMRFPAEDRTWTSARTLQTFCPAIRHRDSVSTAAERRSVFSNRRESRISVSVGRPGSNAGEAMGESSVVMVKMPSKARSGKGLVTSAEMLTRTLDAIQCETEVFIARERRGERAIKGCNGLEAHLVFPRRTSATPYSSPNEISSSLNWSKARPSTRRFSWSALRTNCFSLSEGSTSRGI